ncbi:MAG: tRNA (N6-threonylcarbamoyladenosine(37)-N6)-methyltransferase TrmO [Ignavibacteria bacterium GWA2_55_11]|nr:MAG: tRNA (N6-threonylcarbamoyladenosine(37)-N6)-methyltransferase TrmO [Ignavibacteria bacterium GWA2_55_11]OGU63243.1 MAG: tRNA (N6-threonylcarbamoyladenosine(37)-N6)-methyltransferase TrmO [Ignavibacteria bacterium RIFCSPHIGHO2_02_FULL_56_12]OGU70958.1 MAG: tRNA (N6-threonylcarbamoyladenosine(37)-N6)-methyltransferase TrmO [Ignavibacteria bacterium RIFCSPLOWO2_02_FULL_55_14]OGU76566.1 MAG: tRNA (N6-threonylcarbamoyladenosine(37)-N6)-methyltransferase TrmO [Ignavibacteria bacterium RIFCSPLO
MQIILEPIAIVRNSGTKVDDRWGGVESTIELLPRFGPDALLGIDEFSHLEILFSFDRIDPRTIVESSRHPRNNPQWPKVGIFAQRGAVRPNCLGATIVRLLGCEGRTLRVAELDALDGTPVLDIKPVMQEFLPREPVRQSAWSREVMEKYWEVKK